MKTKTKPFALVTLETLTIKRFDHEDEWKAAIDALWNRHTRFTAFRYHHGTESYVEPERWET
ncbi:MAG: hypothetical protein V3V47_01850 [Desulfobacteria bacterium]